jgi:acyl-coenzyme A thioesterase PaaI-like protein
MSIDRQVRREARRAALVRLAASVRRLADVTATTDIEPDQIDRVREQVDAAAQELARDQHDGPYSGLLPKVRDHARPHTSMPLSPIVGECSPVRPEVELALDGERVLGTAVLGKKWIGPPGYAHGGVTAMICDQIVALAARGGGIRGVTKSLEIRYRRPTPLYERLELEGWCETREAGSVRARAEIRAGEQVCVSAEAEMVVARRIIDDAERRAAPDVLLDSDPSASEEPA